MSCKHPAVYETRGPGGINWYACAQCYKPLRPVDTARPCGCLADPLVFGHVHN